MILAFYATENIEAIIETQLVDAFFTVSWTKYIGCAIDGGDQSSYVDGSDVQKESVDQKWGRGPL